MLLFTYVLLGFSHSDIDEVFDWTRVSDSMRDGGLMLKALVTVNGAPIQDVTIPTFLNF